MYMKKGNKERQLLVQDRKLVTHGTSYYLQNLLPSKKLPLQPLDGDSVLQTRVINLFTLTRSKNLPKLSTKLTVS